MEAGGYGSYRDPTASSRILSTNNNAVASASSRLHVRAEAVDSAPTLTKGWRSRHGSVNVLSNRGYISVSKPSRRWKGRRKKISMTEASILLCVIAAGVFAPWVLCRTLNRWLSTDFVSGGPEVALEQITIAALSRAGLRSGDRWPVSVRDEEDNFELIHHPGGAHDLQGRPIELAVPPFYALDDMVVGGKQRQGEAGQLVRKPAFFDGKLISGPVADLIGVYTSEEQRKTGNVDARTIFVSLMSYRDPAWSSARVERLAVSLAGTPLPPHASMRRGAPQSRCAAVGRRPLASYVRMCARVCVCVRQKSSNLFSPPDSHRNRNIVRNLTVCLLGLPCLRRR